jgi:tetratricopeptide (TPR) repeat protein
MKKFIVFIVTAALLLSLCACGGSETGGSDTPQTASTVSASSGAATGSSGIAEPAADAPAHEQLFYEVRQMLETAEQQGNAGYPLVEEYLKGMAQAEISSLRQCADTTLWLRGEGANLAEVIGSAPYGSWDAIVGAGPGSDAPFYFEGLLFTFQGKDSEAQACYDKAAKNPQHKERDFYYLRNLSIEELYKVKEDAAALENEIWQSFTPRTKLLAERTGAEFLPEFHLTMADSCKDCPTDALQYAVNALLVNPFSSTLYSAAAVYAMDAYDVEQAVEFINEGLFMFPEDGTLNYVAALLCVSAEDNAQAKEFLKAAEAANDPDLKEQIDALYEQIGGK